MEALDIKTRLESLPVKTLCKMINAAVNDYEVDKSWKVLPSMYSADPFDIAELVSHIDDLCNSWGLMVTDDLEIIQSK